MVAAYYTRPWEQRYRSRRRRRRHPSCNSCRTVRRAARLSTTRAAIETRTHAHIHTRSHKYTHVYSHKHASARRRCSPQQQQQRARVGPFVSRRARCVVTRQRRSSLLTSVRSRAPNVRNFGPLSCTRTRAQIHAHAGGRSKFFLSFANAILL